LSYTQSLFAPCLARTVDRVIVGPLGVCNLQNTSRSPPLCPPRSSKYFLRRALTRLI